MTPAPPDQGPDDVGGGSPLDPSAPSGRMRLPSPARAATAAGILLATSVLLLAGDLTIVQMAGDEAEVVPFFLQTENFTVAGMRVTNAGSHDNIRAYEMFATGACGYAYRSPIVLSIDTADNATSTASPGRANVTMRSGDGVTWRLPESFDYDDYRVTGNVTFYVVESMHTPDLLRGLDVSTYEQSRREGILPELTIELVNATENATPSTTSTTTGGLHIQRIVRIHVNCQEDGTVLIERGPHPGTNVRFAFSSSEPWLSDLPVHQGVDFLYVAQANEQPDNETYALLADSLQRGSESWIYSMRVATVFDDEGILPDRILRVGVIVTLAGAVALLALALRRPDAPLPPAPTDAALAVAAAGESHLLRLRRTWGLVGALLIPLLAAATYVVFAIVPFTAPTPAWNTSIAGFVLVLDAAVLALWALALLRAHRDLTAWRRVWTRLDAVDLDGL